MDHLILRSTWVDITSFKRNISHGSIKAFILQFTKWATINSIRICRIKLFDIEFMWTPTNLFIRGEGNAYFSMFNFRMSEQVFHCCHNRSEEHTSELQSRGHL